MYGNVDNTGNYILGTTKRGMNIIDGTGKAKNETQQNQSTQGLTPQQLQAKVEALEKKVQDVTDELHRLEKQSIVVVGNYDGTNLPVRANGVRRKIATATP